MPMPEDMSIWMNCTIQESRKEMEKKKEIYSYMLRFNKELARDRQALEKITQFCEVTDMTMREAILLILATADISALHKNILSLTVSTEKGQEKKADEKRDMKRAKQNLSVSFGRDLEKENRPVYEKEQQNKVTEKNQKEEVNNENTKTIEVLTEDEQEPIMDSMFEDIFNNF